MEATTQTVLRNPQHAKTATQAFLASTDGVASAALALLNSSHWSGNLAQSNSDLTGKDSQCIGNLMISQETESNKLFALSRVFPRIDVNSDSEDFSQQDDLRFVSKEGGRSAKSLPGVGSQRFQ